ncbi:MAG: cyanophycinase [Thermomicrobiales bacterium]|jgi:cyanophycinase|nr:cyanophycinase [Thermomicrobiales bacterium]MEA2594422.1 cyanophycinase [Thermomicrobiales bacterium]
MSGQGKSTQKEPVESRRRAASRGSPKGIAMPVGGAEVREPGAEIVSTFFELSGGKSARIVILPTASSDPTTGEIYLDVFRKMGADSVEIARIASREEANSDPMVELFRSASGIYITGGKQARLVMFVAGTRSADAIEFSYQQGTVVAGTSAGASFLPAHVMAEGEAESAPRKGMVDLVAGLGLLDDVLIDQHFNNRGRFGRLLAVFAGNPGLIHLGIDENTAMVIQPDGIARVIGENSVTVVDGRNVISDYFEREEGEVITISGSLLHVLGRGRCFDLFNRVVVDLEQEQTRQHAAA